MFRANPFYERTFSGASYSTLQPYSNSSHLYSNAYDNTHHTYIKTQPSYICPSAIKPKFLLKPSQQFTMITSDLHNQDNLLYNSQKSSQKLLQQLKSLKKYKENPFLKCHLLQNHYTCGDGNQLQVLQEYQKELKKRIKKNLKKSGKINDKYVYHEYMEYQAEPLLKTNKNTVRKSQNYYISYMDKNLNYNYKYKQNQQQSKKKNKPMMIKKQRSLSNSSDSDKDQNRNKYGNGSTYNKQQYKNTIKLESNTLMQNNVNNVSSTNVNNITNIISNKQQINNGNQNSYISKKTSKGQESERGAKIGQDRRIEGDEKGQLKGKNSLSNNSGLGYVQYIVPFNLPSFNSKSPNNINYTEIQSPRFPDKIPTPLEQYPQSGILKKASNSNPSPYVNVSKKNSKEESRESKVTGPSSITFHGVIFHRVHLQHEYRSSAEESSYY